MNSEFQFQFPNRVCVTSPVIKKPLNSSFKFNNYIYKNVYLLSLELEITFTFKFAIFAL